MRLGRRSLALKQGVVLKLARSVTVSCGLNWEERSQTGTYHSLSLFFSPSSYCPYQSFPISYPWDLQALVGYHTKVIDIWGQLENIPPTEELFFPTCIGFSLDQSDWCCWSVRSSGLSAACPGCAAGVSAEDLGSAGESLCDRWHLNSFRDHLDLRSRHTFHFTQYDLSGLGQRSFKSML